MHICTHFFAIPMNNQRNSHTEAGESRIHIPLQSTQHLQYHLLLFFQAVLTLWGPSPGMVFQTQTACAAKSQLSAQNPFFFYHTYTFMVLPKEFSLPKCRVRAQSLLQSSLSISAGLWALFLQVTGLQLAVSPQSPHRSSAEGTKLEPSFLRHEGMDTHNTWIWAKATPCHQLHSLKRDPAEFWLNSPFLGKPQAHNAWVHIPSL